MTDGGMAAGEDPGRRWPRLIVIAVILPAVLAAVVLLRRPGGAAVRLAGSNPADGAQLGSVPAAVTLDFSGIARLGSVHVVVEDASGATVSRGAPQISGNQVIQPVSATGDGLFQIGYHLVSTDGAELSGVLRFTVGPASAAAAPPAPDAAAGHTHLSKDPLSLLLVLIDLILTVVLLVAMLGRRRPAARRNPHG